MLDDHALLTRRPDLCGLVVLADDGRMLFQLAREDEWVAEKRQLYIPLIGLGRMAPTSDDPVRELLLEVRAETATSAQIELPPATHLFRLDEDGRPLSYSQLEANEETPLLYAGARQVPGGEWVTHLYKGRVGVHPEPSKSPGLLWVPPAAFQQLKHGIRMIDLPKIGVAAILSSHTVDTATLWLPQDSAEAVLVDNVRRHDWVGDESRRQALARLGMLDLRS